MKRLVLAVLIPASLLFSACAASPTALPASVPTPTAHVQPTSPPTATPLPASPPASQPTLSPCPAGSLVFSSAAYGFYVCYPIGWTVWARRDPDLNIRWVEFIAPAPGGSTREELQFISVSISPQPLGPTEDEFLRQMDKAFQDEYRTALRQPPHVVELDGRRALQVSYETVVPAGRAVVQLVKWDTIFLPGVGSG